MSRAATIAIVLSALAVVAPAGAQQATLEQARALFNVGAQAYEKGNYGAALEAFEAAYAKAPRPGIAFSIAQAQRRQYHVSGQREHLEQAIRRYRDYLDATPTGGRRPEAVQALVELEAILARLQPEEAPETPVVQARRRTRLMVSSFAEAARIGIDDGKLTESPAVADVEPGKHQIRVEAEGFVSVTRTVIAVEGELTAFNVDLTPLGAKMRLVADQAADVHVDGQLVGRTPLNQPIELDPGRRSVAVLANGYEPLEIPVTLERGKTADVRAELEPTKQRIASYALFGTAGVAAITGGVFAGLALLEENAASDLRAQSTRENITAGDQASYADAVDRRDMWKRTAIITWSAGLGLGAVGAVLFAFDTPAPPDFRPERTPAEDAPTDELQVSTHPVIGPGVYGAAMSGRF